MARYALYDTGTGYITALFELAEPQNFVSPFLPQFDIVLATNPAAVLYGYWNGSAFTPPTSQFGAPVPMDLQTLFAVGDHNAKKIGLPMTVTNPTRALNTTFQPSATKPCWVHYSVQIQCTLSVLAGQDSTVDLVIDGANPPTTVRGRLRNSNAGILGLTNIQIATMSGWVPAGQNCRLNSSGNATVSLVNSTEVQFG